MSTKTQFLETKDGNQIAYQLLNPESSNKKRPLVMVMGLTGVKENWGEFSKRLAADRTVLVFDNRAIGESKPSPAAEASKDYGITLDSMAKDTAQLIEAQGWKEVDLLGWSMGGWIAQNLTISTLKRPSNYRFRVKKLVLCGTAAMTPKGSPLVSALLQIPERKVSPSAGERVQVANERLKLLKRILRLNFSEEYLAKHGDEVDKLAQDNANYRVPFRVVMQQLKATGKFDYSKDLGLLKDIPTLIIHGTGDRILLHEGSKDLLRLIPGSIESKSKNKSYGHYFFVEDDFVDEIRSHLDSSSIKSKL